MSKKPSQHIQFSKFSSVLPSPLRGRRSRGASFLRAFLFLFAVSLVFFTFSSPLRAQGTDSEESPQYLVRLQLFFERRPTIEAVGIYLGDGQFLIPNELIPHLRRIQSLALVDFSESQLIERITDSNLSAQALPSQLTKQQQPMSWPQSSYFVLKIKNLKHESSSRLRPAHFATYSELLENSAETPIVLSERLLERSISREFPVTASSARINQQGFLEIPAPGIFQNPGGVLVGQSLGQKFIIGLGVLHESSSLSSKRIYGLLDQKMVQGLKKSPPLFCSSVLFQSP